MEDNFGKYLRLFGSLFFSVIGFILAMLLVFFCIRVFFGVLSYVPWISYIYMIFILSVPAAVFMTVYIIFFKRTATHPVKPVRIISYGFFSMALLAWAWFYINDLVIFYRHVYPDVSMYGSYDMIFLFINVLLIFLIGIVQALTTGKEKDWMERGGGNDTGY